MRIIRVLTAAVAALAAVIVVDPLPSHAAAGQRINLRVLVVTDGGSPTEAIRARLVSEGVPITVVDLNSTTRPTITAAYLETVTSGVPVAKFQAVVLPSENPFGNAAETTALTAYEKKFGVRQIDAFSYSSPAVGLNYPDYLGMVDGRTATVTAAGKSGPFGYLNGPVTFEDNDSSVSESYAFLGAPMADDPALSSHFEPLLTMPYPNREGSGVLAGVFTHEGRDELVLTFAYNSNQQQFKALAHGIITWATKGIHLGYQRNYFALHVDDVFLPDARWSTEHNCTPGENCTTPGVTTPDIRMLPADVSYAAQWQRDHGFTMDMYFNGGGSVQAAEATGTDALADAFVAVKNEFRWGNHTYEHPFLGCVRNDTVVPWQCQRNARGAIQYVSRAEIASQITQNRTWANQRGLPIQANELVTGEHSGFFILPQQPADNPNLGLAFMQAGIAWAGSDNSRDPNQRTVGSARTVPRHPMNIFFNVATKSEEVDEYNWIYTSRANGGSGICEDNPATTTCLAPLPVPSGFDDKIVPAETTVALSHILGNDSRPHYVHQSNLTEDRVIYPVLNGILDRYRSIFAPNTPIVNQRLSGIGTQLAREKAWRTVVANDMASGYYQDGKVTVTGPAGIDIPLTLPEGTRKGNAIWGTAYAGERSAWEPMTLLPRTLTFTVPLV